VAQSPRVVSDRAVLRFVALRLPLRKHARASLAFAFLAACSSTGGAPVASDASDAHRARSDARPEAGGAHDSGRDATRESDARADVDARCGADCGSDASVLNDSASDAPSSSDAPADAPPPWSFVPTTSLASLTQNNTSACGSAVAPCTQAWSSTNSVTYTSGSTYAGQTKSVDGFWNRTVPSGTQAPGSSYGVVSKVPMSALLPGYASVPIWVETQNWWGGTTGGHITNGERSGTADQINNQVADHISRGFAGQVIDWDGKGTTEDLALPFIRAAGEASGGVYKFAVMIDKAFFQYGCPGGANAACVSGAIAYLVANYTSSPAYLKDAAGHPIIFYFVNSYYPADYAILTDGGVNADGTVFVMYEPNGFAGSEPPSTIGEYAWVNPSDGATYASTTGSAGTFSSAPDFGFKDLTSYLGKAASNPTAFRASEAHRGFDDNLANWSLDRVIDAQCGVTWLETFHHTGSFGGSTSYQGSLDYLQAGHSLDMVLVDTWDDYEEGSEVETGIDNCMSALSVTLSGSTLSWSPTWGTDPMNSAVSGSESTVYEYAVFLSEAGGAGVMKLADVMCNAGTCAHSLDVSTYGVQGGPYVFYVEAIGLPSIVNHIGGPTATTYSAP